MFFQRSFYNYIVFDFFRDQIHFIEDCATLQKRLLNTLVYTVHNPLYVLPEDALHVNINDYCKITPKGIT